jgi:heterodisulfide reductase subunit C2
MAVPTAQEATLERKTELFENVRSDVRFKDYVRGCYECGICVAACPSARFYDFSPRKITQAVCREDVDLFWTHLNEDVWNCSQCFSCDRCPRGNSPGGLITIMRETAINAGLRSAKRSLEGGERVVYKIMSTGTQVSPDMLQPEAFPDWGPEVKRVSENLDLWRRALPPETMHTTTTAWEVSDRTLVELYLIWHMTGVMDMIKAVDEGLHMILTDVMEELLEDNDIVVS